MMVIFSMASKERQLLNLSAEHVSLWASVREAILEANCCCVAQNNLKYRCESDQDELVKSDTSPDYKCTQEDINKKNNLNC